MRCTLCRLALLCATTFSFASSASAELIYAIAAQGPGQTIISFDSADPGSTSGGPFISGLQTNEAILGIDFRPATGQLYALGSTSRLYTLDPGTGVVTQVGAGAFGPPSLAGVSYGFDFNPMIDRIRVVSESNQNLVLNPNDGTVTGATPLFFDAGDPNAGQNPDVVHSAYSNNVPNAASTTLYGIDTKLDILVTQQASAGNLSTVGPLLTVNPAAVGGFDISGATGIAYAAMMPSGGSVSNLYTINLATGAAALVGQIDGGLTITAMSVAPIPEPATLAMAALALIGCAAVGRRR